MDSDRVIDCVTNLGCENIDNCDKKIDCTTFGDLAEGKKRYICGRVNCEYSENRDNMVEQVNHPSHYQKAGRKECIVEMEEKYGIPATIGFCLMNAYKYLYRAGDKADNSCEQDRRKAEWYFDYANKLLEKTDVEDCFKENSNLYLDIKGMLEI